MLRRQSDTGIQTQDADRSAQQIMTFSAPVVCSECLAGIWVCSLGPPDVGSEIARLKLERVPLLMSLPIERGDASAEMFCGHGLGAGFVPLICGSKARDMPRVMTR